MRISLIKYSVFSIAFNWLTLLSLLLFSCNTIDSESNTTKFSDKAIVKLDADTATALTEAEIKAHALREDSLQKQQIQIEKDKEKDATDLWDFDIQHMLHKPYREINSYYKTDENFKNIFYMEIKNVSKYIITNVLIGEFSNGNELKETNFKVYLKPNQKGIIHIPAKSNSSFPLEVSFNIIKVRFNNGETYPYVIVGAFGKQKKN